MYAKSTSTRKSRKTKENTLLMELNHDSRETGLEINYEKMQMLGGRDKNM